METQVNVEDILKRAEQINIQITKHNSNNQKQEGYREATRKQLINQVNEYNQKYGTAISIEDTESLQREYINELQSIHTETNKLENVLDAVKANDIARVSELTGIDISQDTIKMPEIDIDIETLEKQADKAYEDAMSDIALTEGVAEVQQGLTAEDIEVKSENVEDDNESTTPPTDFSNLFGGTKVSGGSKASDEDQQTKSNTEPNFENVFGQSSGAKVNEEVVETSKTVETPNFSAMFSQVKTETKKEEPIKEAEDIGSFVQGFAQPKSDDTSSRDTSNVDNALKNQTIPVFNFGTIDDE